MRQLNENFLRGATGEPSLQQADGKIDGAAAETDKDLPPGRFARFVDGANAFYRDPANAKLQRPERYRPERYRVLPGAGRPVSVHDDPR